MIRIANPDQIGHILRTLRTQQKLRQWQVAEATGLRQGQISALERGEHYPTTPGLVRVAGALGYDLAFIPREDA